MDSPVTVRNSSMVDAFTMLLAIQLDARSVQKNRYVRVRKTVHDRRPVAVYGSVPIEGDASVIAGEVTHLVVEFHQWEGCVRLFALDRSMMDSYMDPTSNDRVNQKASFDRLFRDIDPRIFAVDELTRAAVTAAVLLEKKYERLPIQGLDEYKTTMKYVHNFMKLRGRAGRIPIEMSDLARLLGLN